MSASKSTYATEYRRHMVELVRSGRTPAELSREFECSRQSIRNWVKRAEQEEGQTTFGARNVVNQEKQRLLKENGRLGEECEILKRVLALFARENGV